MILHIIKEDGKKFLADIHYAIFRENGIMDYFQYRDLVQIKIISVQFPALQPLSFRFHPPRIGIWIQTAHRA